MVLRGDAVAETTISTIDEAFTDCALPTPPGRTPLWGPGSIPNNWADVCGFLQPPGSDRIGKCACMVHSPSHEELLACDQLIKVAIMRHGSIWISSTDATLRNRKVNTVDTFPSKNVLRHIITGNRKDAAVKSRATIGAPRICTPFRTRCSIFCETCTSSRSELMTFRS